MDERRLTDVERLAIAQALYKKIAELVDTKDPDSLRSAVDRGYKELYEQTGAKSFEVKLNGQSVGNYSVRISKKKPSATSKRFMVKDYEKLAKWFVGLDVDTVKDYAAQDLEKFALWHTEATGELPDGCKIVETITTVGGEYMGGTLKVDPQEVINAMGEQLPPSIAGLLEG